MSSSASVVLRRVVPVLAALAVILGAFAVAPAQADDDPVTVSGVVTDSNGAPRVDATVTVQQFDDESGEYLTPREVSTDSQGAFSDDEVERGSTHRVRVNPKYHSFGEAFSAPFVVNGDVEVPTIVTLPGRAVTGTVVTAGSDPQALKGKSVTAFRVEGDVVDSAGESVTTTSGGTFNLDRLAPGTYKIGVADGDGAFAPTFYGSDRIGEATVVTTEDTALDLGTIAMHPGATLTGRVLTDKGKATEFAEVFAYDVLADGSIDKRHAHVASVTSKGVWTVASLAPGNYKVEVLSDDYLDEFYNGAVTAAGAQTLALASGQTLKLADTTLETGSAFTGKIVNTSKAGLAGIVVTAYAVDGSGNVAERSSGLAETNKKGTFTLEPLRTGKYQLVALDLKHAYVRTTLGTFTVGVKKTKSAGTRVIKKEPGPATITVSAKGAKAKATFKITVKTSKVTPTGSVQVLLDGSAPKTAKLKKGKATITVTKQAKGKHTYTIAYLGDDQVFEKSVSKTVTIK
ncbi:MAG: hypothetical protein JWQ91_3197 [Aeromicrobium sp.]|jgi:hypothetical protein|uniref:Ig-like domain repeat protein n=1 Tax=Aeromicrobium sp. TaxID=1871063 RepID=UPI002625DE88|nr:Ig-like domain repeat protein [Aeromicrobium sp.]MCW2826280.1 hypothetical protein [Aeromicrobium sp.]